MKRAAALLFVILTIPVMLSSPAAADSQPALSIPDEDAALMERINTEFTDDLDRIKSRKLIRVLASISRTNFFFHKGKLHGFEYELMKAYEINNGTNGLKWSLCPFRSTEYSTILRPVGGISPLPALP